MAGALHWVLSHGDPLAWLGGLLDARAAAWAAEVGAPAGVTEDPLLKDAVCCPA